MSFAYRTGFDDARAGKDISDCPYKGITEGSKVLRARWLAGFNEGLIRRANLRTRDRRRQRVKGAYAKRRLAEISQEGA